MTQRYFDVIVIGSGPGGEGAAMKAAKEGKRVAVVERYATVGGGCTHWGTIPSKALRHAIARMNECLRSPFAPRGYNDRPPFGQIVRTAESVVRSQVSMREGFYGRNNVPIIAGHARFHNANTICIRTHHGIEEHYEAAHFIIATGSRPYRPVDVDFNHPRIFDADTVLKMRDTPSSLTIYGAGVIGCEYASMFRGLDVKINLVNTRSKLLEFLDDEIIDALAYHMRDTGTLIRHDEECERIEPLDDGVVLYLKSGKALKTEALLWANGRTGNTDGMGLEDIGLEPNHRGQIAVNQDYQTKLPHIYAVGDVIGPPALASAAYDQGRFAASHIIDPNVHHHLVQYIPTGIYTTPGISSVGRTERQLTEAKVPYEVGRALFRSLARAQITGNTMGMLKLLFHRETLEILGIHCFGDQAPEIIHIGQAIMTQPAPQNTLDYFVNTTFNYPTMAEAYRVAALNGLNRVF
ncbi:MAG: Si-specific NAD(P)(+) transhydrogenase [Planctomycetes bacterium]|nr:Si-specific NAD(P)(+) transhydrogenase [Planctomycetota bacterium]